MTYQMINLETVINIRIVALKVYIPDHLESLDLNLGSESYDSNTKIYSVRI